MADKRYFWIKLKQSFYENNDAVDFLMSQTDGNGAQYVVLYQMLCLKTANNGGGLYSRLGEIIVPYDVDKIVRDCKYFERDIVTKALGHYKRIGLVYEEQANGYLVISDIESMIGSETNSAERKRRQRNREKAGQCHGDVTQIVTEDIDIEIDDISSAVRNSTTKKTSKVFVEPTLAEVQAYCEERGNSVDAQRFIDYYTSNGWKVGRNTMKDWKAAVRIWESQPLTSNVGNRTERKPIVPIVDGNGYTVL